MFYGVHFYQCLNSADAKHYAPHNTTGILKAYHNFTGSQKKKYFHISVSRQIESTCDNWTPLPNRFLKKCKPCGPFLGSLKGPLGTQILVNFFLHCQALPSGPETATKPSLLICSRSILYNDSTIHDLSVFQKTFIIILCYLSFTI